PASLIALALAAFGIGTTEFVIMGLLPDVARDLGVSIPAAGWLVTGYALAVAFGAPLMALATARLPRKAALVGLMGVFIFGNLLCALAGGYATLMVARVVTALCHGAFFGIGAVVAAGLVAENKRASAVALMFTGLTLANVLGVPLGTALGQAMGWRTTFYAVVLIGLAALAALVWLVPRDAAHEPADLKRELRVFRKPGVWVALGMTVFSSASMFAMFTYIAPILGDVTGVTPRGVTFTLLLIGLGLTIGNIIGGKLADWKLLATLIGLFIAMAVVQTVFSWTSRTLVPAEITLFIWGAIAFAAVPALQIGVVSQARDAPNLASTLNIGAFNMGNALGAWAGGVVIAQGYALTTVPLAGAGLALVGLVLALVASQREKTLARASGAAVAAS
ncbi:MAG: transporter, partial [Rhodoferax sp.]|nr:transporter [Rhodoferax sp.]